jgi:hypothetical protein
MFMVKIRLPFWRCGQSPEQLRQSIGSRPGAVESRANPVHKLCKSGLSTVDAISAAG